MSSLYFLFYKLELLTFVIQVITGDDKSLRGSCSWIHPKFVRSIVVSRVDDAESLCSVITILAMTKKEHIFAPTRLSYLWKSFLKMPSDGFAIAIHPQRVFAINKHAIVW